MKSWDTWWVRLLRKPVRHRFVQMGDEAWEAVDASPYPYGYCPVHVHAPNSRLRCFVLTPLSILHRWTGLTLVTPVHCGDETCDEAHP